jgi:hypothetical protein
LKEIERILSAPDQRPAIGTKEYGKAYYTVIQRAMDAAEEEGGGYYSWRS